MLYRPHYIILITVLLLSVSSYSQHPPTVEIVWENKEVVINQETITSLSNITQIRKALGPESRILRNEKTPTKLYIYDSLGINFLIDTTKAIVQKIDIYCSPGRGGPFITSPEKLFTGIFMINKEAISVTESIESIREKTKLPLEEMGIAFYWFTVDNEEFSLTIAYTNKNKDRIGSLYIILSSENE
jgi:hypothetical protein